MFQSKALLIGQRRVKTRSDFGMCIETPGSIQMGVETYSEFR
jgi:hypothetical protein